MSDKKTHRFNKKIERITINKMYIKSERILKTNEIHSLYNPVASKI